MLSRVIAKNVGDVFLRHSVYWKMTKLCRFNQGNPHFSAFERHAELAESERVH